MIFIKKKAYYELCQKEVHEECGVLAGKQKPGKKANGIKKSKYYSKVYDIKNRAWRKNRFRISFFDKMKLGINMWKNDLNVYILYHVHKKGLQMSVDDVKNAKLGSLNIVICKGQMKIFKVVLTRKGKNCIPITFKLT